VALRNTRRGKSIAATRICGLRIPLLPGTINAMTFPKWLRSGTRRMLRQRVALFMLLAIGHAGYALAAHVHPLDAERSGQHEICGFCLHAERLGAAPPVESPFAIAPANAPPPSDTPEPALTPVPRPSYQSRAPPSLTP
jgi:hypothetical protein